MAINSKISLGKSVVVQPERTTDTLTVQRVVFLVQQNIWRIFTQELGPIDVSSTDPNFSKLPTIDQQALTDIVSANADALAARAGQTGAGRLGRATP
jgi:hypothetical protein